MLTRTAREMPGFTVVTSPEAAAELASSAPRAMVIGGGSIYRQMLPLCDTAYVTKILASYPADRYFPNLDTLPDWQVAEEGDVLEEDGVKFRYVTYRKK
jgi:dihydrofolate reductase